MNTPHYSHNNNKASDKNGLRGTMSILLYQKACRYHFCSSCHNRVAVRAAEVM